GRHPSERCRTWRRLHAPSPEHAEGRDAEPIADGSAFDGQGHRGCSSVPDRRRDGHGSHPVRRWGRALRPLVVERAFVEGFIGSQGGERMTITRGSVLPVTFALPRDFESNVRPARSAIWKSPVAGRVAARGVNLAGDDQADRRAHGGPDKAIYAYAVEDLGW